MTHKVMCIIKLLRIIKFSIFLLVPAHTDQMNVLLYEIHTTTKRKYVHMFVCYKLSKKQRIFSIPLPHSRVLLSLTF